MKSCGDWFVFVDFVGDFDGIGSGVCVCVILRWRDLFKVGWCCCFS